MLISRLKTFVRRHEYLICIDSDGTAMDVMNIKHKRCFGPCFIKEWHLEAWEDELLALWNDVNLYRETRGKNRFITLLIALQEVNEKYLAIEDIDVLADWVEHTTQYSNQSLYEEIARNPSPILRRALEWSQAVNSQTRYLTYDEKKPFTGVKEFLEKASKVADIAIVSSAGFAIIKEEWKYHNLLQYVGTLATQEDGGKEESLEKLRAKGYAADHILMIGDALSDLSAASNAGVCFCPVVPGRETESWKILKEDILPVFLQGNYREREPQELARLNNFFHREAD